MDYQLNIFSIYFYFNQLKIKVKYAKSKWAHYLAADTYNSNIGHYKINKKVL